jgi:hypothetical protein
MGDAALSSCTKANAFTARLGYPTTTLGVSFM